MATLPQPRLRVTTAAGVPVSGGKLRLYNAGTSTPSSLFTEATLTTPLSNPVVAASDGFLPQIFAAEGLVVDGDFLTAGDVVIAGQSFVNAVFVGANTGAITRDFSTGGRLWIGSRSAGIISIEAADPIGDDVGGKLRLGGYNSTQADTISLDGAAVDITGTLTEAGHKLPGIVYTPATTFSAVASVNIALPNSPTGIRSWMVNLWDIITPASPGTNSFSARLSYDGGVNYKSGASDYAYDIINYDTGTTSVNEGRTSGATSMLFNAGSNLTTTAGRPARFSLHIITPNSGTDPTSIDATIMGWTQEGTPKPYKGLAGLWAVGSYGRATHIQVLPNAGTFSGSYRVEALRGYGE